MKSAQFTKLSEKKSSIGIIGLGYVGLPLACLLAEKYKVVGFDINEQRVKELSKGFDRTHEIENRNALTRDSISYTTNPEALKQCSVMIVTVPTPVDDFKKPDLRPLFSASETVGRYMSPGTLVVYESTVYPGCTENECRKVIEKHSKLEFQKDFELGYSPERVNPGDKQHTIDKITKIISASSSEALELLAQIYGSVIQGGVYKAPNIKTAEAAKVIENIQRDINIALVNELALIFDRCGVDTKEVLEAAGTKWNFLKFTPGLVGGHCFSGKHNVTLVNSGHHKIRSFENYWDELIQKTKGTVTQYGDTELLKPFDPIQTLSFDKAQGKAVLKNVTVFSKSSGKPGFRITTAGNHVIEVSTKHPMAIDENGEWFVKFAENIGVGDRLPLLQEMPERSGIRTEIDLIAQVPEEWRKRYRVKRKNGTWRALKDTLHIKKHTGKKASNFYHLDYLPLEIFLQLEAKGVMPVPRSEVLLVSGRGGGSFQTFPSVVTVNADLARLVGYYLSEGCITHDNKSTRVRFTFNRNEKETIKDCRNLIKKVGLASHSLYDDKTFQATTIKASSELFGYLLEHIFKCGVRSEDARIPEEFLYGSESVRWNTLIGLLRGDGGVDLITGIKGYKKNGKMYSHQRNFANVSFFSISPEMLHGAELLLMGFGISYTKDKDRPLIEIQGTENLDRFRDVFLDAKKEKLATYFEHKIRSPKSKIFERHKGYVTAPVKKIEPIHIETLYSMEVEGTHAVVTDSGIITHNCIGVDPYYLTYMAEGLGMNSQLVLSGRRINDSIGPFIAEKAIKLVMNGNTSVSHPLKFIVAGLTFKENVPDLRNSKVIDLIQGLENFGAQVYCVDPVCDPTEFEEIYKRTITSWEDLPVCDAVIVAVKHKKFSDSLSLYEIERKLEPKHKVLLDLKGIYDRELAKSLGINIWRL